MYGENVGGRDICVNYINFQSKISGLPVSFQGGFRQ